MNYDLKIIFKNNIIYSINIIYYNKLLQIRSLSLILPYSILDAISLFNNVYIKFNFDFSFLTINLLSIYKYNLEIYIIEELFILFELLINYDFFLQSLFNIRVFKNLTLSGLSQNIFL